MSISDIKSALEAEMKAIPQYYLFKVLKITPLNHGLLIDVQARPTDGSGNLAVLDEGLIGTNAWWVKPYKGMATVQNVDPGKNQILLNKITGNVPHENQDIRLYPLNFIQPLLNCWNDDTWATQAFDCLKDLAEPKPIVSARLTGDKFIRLRSAQLVALTLINYSSSFLWGPPGTGKTTTLGVMLAEYLQANPFANILFLSTTNRAVDQATIAVDDALKHAKYFSLRNTIRRFGSGYDLKQYAGREHLLGNAIHFSANGSHDCTLAESTVEISSPFDSTLRGVRLRTMTIASAIFSISALRKLPKFDLLVLDEASQISLAHTLAVMPLGNARLFAGDPVQLSPVAQSPALSVQRWLKQSAFAHKPPAGPSVCQLNEQSRMIGPICDVISSIFYDGNLRVADAQLDDWYWLKARKNKFGHIPRNEHFCIQKVTTNAIRSLELKGWIRPESAEMIVRMILSAIQQKHVSLEDVIVITPFRLQRALLRDMLVRHDLKSIMVSTVHSVQGAEAPVVIFDPVNGSDEFLMNQVGRQLINVALSRAQSKLILALSPGDLANPLFSQMLNFHQSRSNRAVKPIAQVLADPNYITRGVGERVYINSQLCEIIRFSRSGAIMWLVIESSRKEIFVTTDDFREHSMLAMTGIMQRNSPPLYASGL